MAFDMVCYGNLENKMFVIDNSFWHFPDSEPSLLTLNSLDVVTVNLYDTTGKTDVHINRELVETQLAEYTGK